MSKTFLKLLSLVMIIFGITTLMPSLLWSSGAEWYGFLKIIFGVVGFAIAFSDKKSSTN